MKEEKVEQRARMKRKKILKQDNCIKLHNLRCDLFTICDLLMAHQLSNRLRKAKEKTLIYKMRSQRSINKLWYLIASTRLF